MARIRSIKPETPRDAKLARVSRGARLTFLYLWTQADDEGWFTATPRSLLGDLYPHDHDITEAMLVRELDELRSIGLLDCFDTPDGVLGKVVNFKKHQRIDHASKSYLATLSRDPRETFSKGVLSLESVVLSPEQKGTVAQSATPAPAGAPPADEPKKKSNLPVRRGNSLVAVQDHLRSIDDEVRANLLKAEARRLLAELGFSYWSVKHNHPKALLDEKRERVMTKFLEANSDDISEMLYIIDGSKADAWAAEELSRHDVTVLFRDRSHGEKYLTSAKYKRGEPHAVAVKYLTPVVNGNGKAEAAEPAELVQ